VADPEVVDGEMEVDLWPQARHVVVKRPHADGFVGVDRAIVRAELAGRRHRRLLRDLEHDRCRKGVAGDPTERVDELGPEDRLRVAVDVQVDRFGDAEIGALLLERLDRLGE
jgi:hypothetical protein